MGCPDLIPVEGGFALNLQSGRYMIGRTGAFNEAHFEALKILFKSKGVNIVKAGVE